MLADRFFIIALTYRGSQSVDLQESKKTGSSIFEMSGGSTWGASVIESACAGIPMDDKL